MCCGQRTLSKIDEIYPLAIPKQIFTISVHIPSLVKIHWYLLNFFIRKWKYRHIAGRWLSKIDKLCPSAIRNQICTISMHIPSLTKIHWHLLKLSLEIKIQTCCGQIAVKNWQNLPISNPKPDLYNINTQTNFAENSMKFTQVIIWKQKYGWTGSLRLSRTSQLLTHRKPNKYHNTPPLSCGRV